MLERVSFAAVCLAVLVALGGCKRGEDDQNKSAQPRAWRDVPAVRLAFHFEPDVGDESKVPEPVREAEGPEKIEAIQTDFETRRPDEELLRTVASPDGERAIALYATRETEGYDFRMDLYATSGAFIRNILPQNMVGSFAEEVAWSPDGSQIAFIGISNPAAEATPDPGRETTAPPVDPSAEPAAAPTVAPSIPLAPVFKTEQIYVADRDGLGIRPLTTREGLIYFELAWAPDGHALAVLACREDEWIARKNRFEAPGGRPRIINMDGEERLLDDRLADAAPAWSPDSSKLATAFDKTIAIFDAAGGEPTGANLPLEEPLWSASFIYDAKIFGKQKSGNTDASQSEGQSSAPTEVPPLGSVPVNSFNPVVRVAWVSDETIYVQTAFIRYLPNDPVPTIRYVRWHRITLQLPET